MRQRRYAHSNCLILGEIHTSKQSKNQVQEQIELFKPDVILHELLYEDLCQTPEEARQRLSECGVGKRCDPRLNKDIYQLGVRLKTILVGIDLPEGGTFRAREQRMVELIEAYFKRYRTVVVVGDTHLRDKPIPRVPHRSLLRERFDNEQGVVIKRAPVHLQEAN